MLATWPVRYFHGDNGRGVGSSHQTGWTGLIAKLPGTQESFELLGLPVAVTLCSPSSFPFRF